VTPYWKQITQHRRNPKHLLIPLPWSFKDVYDDLICSDISYLNVPTDDLILSGPPPIAARGFSQATSHSTIVLDIYQLVNPLRCLLLLVFIKQKMEESLLATTILDSSSPSAASTQSFEDTDEIIDTEYFDIPFPPATANMATTSNTQQFEDIDSASTITDHLQYLSYDS